MSAESDVRTTTPLRERGRVAGIMEGKRMWWPLLAALALAACGSGGGDVLGVYTGSGDATESLYLPHPADIHALVTATNDGHERCSVRFNVRMSAQSSGGGSGTGAEPGATDTSELGFHLAAGDWLFDVRTATFDTSRAGMTCHWKVVLTTSDRQDPDLPKVECYRPGTVTFPAGPVCDPGDTHSRIVTPPPATTPSAG
jgi:hypothetical protein